MLVGDIRWTSAPPGVVSQYDSVSWGGRWKGVHLVSLPVVSYFNFKSAEDGCRLGSKVGLVIGRGLGT